LGRNTQGVTLIRLREGEKLVGIARIETEEKNGESAELADELEADELAADEMPANEPESEASLDAAD
jgi:DNA gyrase subunit A